MFCYKCGAQAENGAAFCVHCGTKLLSVEVSESATLNQAPFEYPLYTSCPPVPELPPKKPVNKKKLALSLVSVLLCLSLVVGIFAYFTYYATAERKIREAADDSVDSLEELLGDGAELVRLIRNLRNYKEEFTLKLSAEERELSLAYSKHKEILSFLYNNHGRYSHLAADNEKLVLDFPGRSEEAYSVPLSKFGQMFLNSSLSAEIPSEARAILSEIELHIFDLPSREDIKDQEFYEDLKDAIEIEKVDAIIPHSKGVDTVYHMEMDMDDYMRFSKKCSQYMLEPILGKDLTGLLSYSMSAGISVMQDSELNALYGLDKDGRLVAIHFIGKSLVDMGESTIALTGERNPWEQIEVYVDGEAELILSIRQEGNGFAIYANEECVLRGDGEKLVFMPDDTPFTVYYEIREDGCHFYAEDEEMRIDLELLPICEAQMPTGKIVDLFSLSRPQIEELAKRIANLLK